jgi:hypothetical protein
LPRGGFIIKARTVNKVGRKFLDALLAGTASPDTTAKGIPALVSNGEYFIPPGAVANFGKSFLDAINRAADIAPPAMPRAFASGGIVGGGGARPASRGGDFTVNVPVTVSGQQSGGGQGVDASRAAELGKRLKDTVKAAIVEEMRPGGLLY